MEEKIKQLQEQLAQQEKLASLGMLTAGIAHEVRNPLNFIINFAKLSDKLATDIDDIISDNEANINPDDLEDLRDMVANLKENMAKITEHGDRANSIVNGILLTSRGKEDEWMPTDVCKLVKEYVWLSYHSMRANNQGFNVAIKEDYDPSLGNVCVIRQDFTRAVLNIMNNACYTVYEKKMKADEKGEEYSPEICITVKKNNDCFCVSIADNGEGMTDEVKQKLYDNFFTTKPAGKGTGLGMCITRHIIEEKHGGKLTFDSTFGKGTTFNFDIPIKK